MGGIGWHASVTACGSRGRSHFRRLPRGSVSRKSLEMSGYLSEMKCAGEYALGYAVEKAEGMYMLRDGELQWHEPEAENIHVEVVVCDGVDHHIIPC
jgi:hypothetical protein